VDLWVQCEAPELRFLKCSMKWDVLTFWFSPVSASLLHSFYSLENATLSLAYFPPPSPLFYILVFSFLTFLRFLWVVVFSLVIMTEPYASHDASKIEPKAFNLLVSIHLQVRHMTYDASSILNFLIGGDQGQFPKITFTCPCCYSFWPRHF